MQYEITESSDLLDPFGELVQKGWARKILFNFNKEYIWNSWPRMKEWDYYAILHPDYGITFTVADIGYLGIIAITWLDFKKKTCISDEILLWFTRGNLALPRTPEEGDIIVNKKGISLSFERKKEMRILKVDYPKFNKGMGIKAELNLTQDPLMDTMVILSSWKKRPTKFYYNQKVNCMPSQGIVTLGKNKYDFNPKNCFGVLDWGRGVWRYKSIWYWGSASAKLDDGSLIGWNLGYGFSDRSRASENIIFYNGKGHKIEDVTFQIDPKDYLKPWKFTSSDGRFELMMEPILDRSSKIDLIVLRSIQHQVFGYFTGDIILDDGKKIHVENILGFAEKVVNRW
ncbi:MAG: DUF2804 domain-containing protein [Promethearchaeota archaeon]